MNCFYVTLSGSHFGENEGHELLALYFIHHFFFYSLKKHKCFHFGVDGELSEREENRFSWAFRALGIAPKRPRGRSFLSCETPGSLPPEGPLRPLKAP